MKQHSFVSFALFAVVLLAAWPTSPSASAQVARFPADKARGVNPDTHLVLTFASPPTLGKSGLIRIYDAADHKLVDTLDLSIPAGPPISGPPPEAPAGAAPAATPPAAASQPAATRPAGVRATNRNTVPGTSATRPGPPPTDYQLTIIGGVSEGFHFHPVIIHDNVATIYPHHSLLDYNRTYIVKIDDGALTTADGSFKGFSGDTDWTFTTKPAPPAADATRVVVAADGSGDFNTVQAALDFFPDKPPRPVTIFIKNGTYEEIIYFRNRSNLTMRGEDREKVQLGYGNNSRFNPAHRCAFAAVSCTGVMLENFTVSNYYLGQAEGLAVSGSRNIVSKVTINGSGDALNLKGSVYLTDCKLTGHGDTILGYGPAYFNNCELVSHAVFNWIRNPQGNHGNVFANCTFIGLPPPNPLYPNRVTLPHIARLPDNGGINYPYAEAILINCRLKGIPAVGWGKIDCPPDNVHFWEYNSTNLDDGKPIDASERHPYSKQLTMEQDAETIKNYSDPAFVLGGWKPVLEP